MAGKVGGYSTGLFMTASSAQQGAKAVEVQVALVTQSKGGLENTKHSQRKETEDPLLHPSSTMSRPAPRKPEYHKIVRSFYKHVLKDVLF